MKGNQVKKKTEKVLGLAGVGQVCAELGRRIEGHADLSAPACAELGRKIKLKRRRLRMVKWAGLHKEILR
jgi:hypothetical protein